MCEIANEVCLSDILNCLAFGVYLFIYFQNLGCNTTTAKAENTIQYMHTWILKDECVATYIAPITVGSNLSIIV